MKDLIKIWFYNTFGKQENPTEIDKVFLGVIIFIVIFFLVGLRILITA